MVTAIKRLGAYIAKGLGEGDGVKVLFGAGAVGYYDGAILHIKLSVIIHNAGQKTA